LIVTHDDSIARQCHRVISMSDGIILSKKQGEGEEEE